MTEQNDWGSIDPSKAEIYIQTSKPTPGIDVVRIDSVTDEVSEYKKTRMTRFRATLLTTESRVPDESLPADFQNLPTHPPGTQVEWIVAKTNHKVWENIMVKFGMATFRCDQQQLATGQTFENFKKLATAESFAIGRVYRIKTRWSIPEKDRVDNNVKAATLANLKPGSKGMLNTDVIERLVGQEIAALGLPENVVPGMVHETVMAEVAQG